MYQDERHPPILNALTERLLKEGYTRERHPEHVYWSDWQNFGYKWEHTLGMTWETPCGLMINGDSAIGRSLGISDTIYDGIWYCAENNNPLVRCRLGKANCPYRVPYGNNLIECPCHQTTAPYDYDRSIEMLEAKIDKRDHRQWMEITGGVYCACVVGSNGYRPGRYQIKYDVAKCIGYDCQNEICAIRKQPRDLTRANIVYDIRRTWITSQGLFEKAKRVTLTKGVKVFGKPIAQTDAEIWLKCYENDPKMLFPKRTPEDRSMSFFSEHHRTWPDYDYFEFHYETENIRIVKASARGRDLLQDLADAAEGIEVQHESDRIRVAKAAKKERLSKAREQRLARLEKEILTSGLDGMEEHRREKAYKRLGIEHVDDLDALHQSQKEPKTLVKEQLELFS